MESGCLRYTVDVTNHQIRIRESAISDGVIITTPQGATGYYSYSDKISKDGIFTRAPRTRIASDSMGVCHILPAYLERETSRTAFFRYTVPIESTVKVALDRPSGARLYGFGQETGIPFVFGEELLISRSKSDAKLVEF